MILLQAFTINDFEQLMAWETNEEALMQFAGPSFSFPLTRHQLSLTLIDKKRLSYSIQYLPGCIVIGHAEIYFPDETTAHLCRILIGDPHYCGRGLGLQTVNELLRISFARAGIAMATLNVFDFNTAAIKCYTKAGFTINESNTKTRQAGNKIWTTLNMQILKTTWQDVQNNISSGSTIP